MREDMEKKKQKRRKKRSRFGYYLYAVVILVLTIVNITIATLLLTYVQRFRITGNIYSQKSQIEKWIREDPWTVNSLYTYFKFKTGAYQLPEYLLGVNVTFDAPWELHVEVEEKQAVGCLVKNNSYVYFDEEGFVLKTSTQYDEGFPLIEGIQVESAEQFEYMKVEDEKVVSYIVSFIEEIREHELEPDRLVWEEESMNLHFGEICVWLGKTNFEEKLVELPPILAELEGNSGILHMEHYTAGTSSINFEKNGEKNY